MKTILTSLYEDYKLDLSKMRIVLFESSKLLKEILN